MNKKGFTLIELLAVIIILAILMIIAIPNILNTLATARKKAFISQAQSIYKTAEQQFVISSMNNNTVACFDDSGSSNLDLSSKSPNLKYYVKLTRSTGKVEEIEVQDTAQGFKIVLTPSQGNDYVLQNEVANATITTGVTGSRSIGTCSGGGTSNNNDNNSNNNNNNNNSGNNSGNNTPDPEPIVTFNGTCVGAPSGNETHSGLPATYKGIVYLDPKNMTETCTASSTLTSGNTGCKKFYIYDDSGSTYKMIMDRNTTIFSGWDLYYDPDSSCDTCVSSTLASDTSGWSGSPRLITADEVATIIGKSNWSSSTAVDGDATIYFGTKDWTYYSNQTAAQKAVQKSYYWLFDYTDGCISHGCITEADEDEIEAYGYWTSTRATSINSDNAWYVYSDGTLTMNGEYGFWEYNVGVRPVIELSKSICS